MSLFTSPNFISFLQSSGYFILFLLMFIEGPITTFVAAFLSVSGTFNIYFVLIISIFGNLVPDILLFLIGRFGRTTTVMKIASFFGLNASRRKRIEQILSANTTRSLILFKSIPSLAVPGLMFAGFSKVSFKKFFITSLLFDVLSGVVFTLLGLYSGLTITSLLKYMKLENYILIALVLLTALVYIIIRFFKRKLRSTTNS